MVKKVFISYATVDGKPFADKVYETLNSDVYDIWLDYKKIDKAIPAPIMQQDGQNEERECHLNERTCARGGKINWHRAKRVRI